MTKALATQTPEPISRPRDAAAIAGIEAYFETARERDEAKAACEVLRRENAELRGRESVWRDNVQKLLAHRDTLTAALSAANCHIRSNHAAYVDMAQVTGSAVKSAAELGSDDPAVADLARRLAPQLPHAAPNVAQMRAVPNERLNAAAE